MGAWGIKNFENDSALDWVGEFVDNADPEFISETLIDVIENDDYIEVDEGSYALAAAEIVAAWNKKKSSDYPEEGMEEIEKIQVNNLSELKTLSLKAIEKVKTNSELKELWEETDEFSEWQALLDDLGKRLE